MDLCTFENEDHDHRVGTGVNSTLLSDTLQSIGLGESSPTRSKVCFRKKPMDLCVYESEEHEHGVGDGVNKSYSTYRDVVFITTE